MSDSPIHTLEQVGICRLQDLASKYLEPMIDTATHWLGRGVLEHTLPAFLHTFPLNTLVAATFALHVGAGWSRERCEGAAFRDCTVGGRIVALFDGAERIHFCFAGFAAVLDFDAHGDVVVRIFDDRCAIRIVVW